MTEPYTRRLNGHRRPEPLRARPIRTPTARQIEVFALALRLGYKGAAAELGLTTNGVKVRLAALYQNLRVPIYSSGSHAMIEAAEILGWLHIPSK